MSTEPASLEFPKDEQEAHSRYLLYRDDDPFEDLIKPALLNSTDIYDYVRVTGMVWPFDTRQETLDKKLKVASYEIDFLGDVYWSDDGGTLRCQKIERDVVFPLKQNSIVFIRLRTTFRLPNYIAVRFNLRITNVHRGLLLGTGPLVDPGFFGNLLIPLHNLTSKDYTLIGGEGFIWAEFTKVSPFLERAPHIRTQPRGRFGFHKTKQDLKPQVYFNKASEGVPARSSIPGAVLEARRIAKDTARKVDRYAWGAIITVAITVLGLLIGLGPSTWQLIADANNHVFEASRAVGETKKSVHEVEVELAKLRSRIDVVEKVSKPPATRAPDPR